jgi:hypothetical protein
MGENRTWTEEYTVDGAEVHAKVSEIIHEGKARRITIRNSQGRTVLRVPLWLGAAAVLKNPKLLLVGALLSRKGPLTLVVEKEETGSEPPREH